jgi:hypothetical protein
MLPLLHQSLLFCYVIFGLIKPEMTATSKRHPLHLSSTEINFNAKTGTVELSCRIFTDDFEDILGKKYKVKTDLNAIAKHAAMDVLVGKYLSTHLQVAVNGKTLVTKYLGFENDNEAVIVYLETEKTATPKKLETSCSVLYDQFDDQINIFHITFNGNRKSSKLTYPDKTMVSVF